MLNSIFGNIVEWISKGIDFVLTWLLQMLGLNVTFFSDAFPVVNTLYVIIQGVGIGIAIVIAAFQVYKYFTGPLSDVRTNPLEIALRLIFSLALIFFGNYILEMIINIASYPYKAMLDVSAASGTEGEGFNVFSTIASGAANMITGGAGTILSLILLICVGWNTIKLALEIVERFLMVGVLTYLSPMAWAAFSSRNTQSILQKYLSMFVGQALLMLLNVWSIKLLLSVLQSNTINVFLSCVLALAFCKVAQRFDSYLQTLGINAAHTGGALLDDMAAVAGTITGLTKNVAGGIATGAGHSTLGSALQKGGVLGAASYMMGRASLGDTSSSIKPNAEGGLDWLDKNTGVVWHAKNQESLNVLRNGIKDGYAKYKGESDIMPDGKGGYKWNDAYGNTHNAKALSDILQTQQDIRSGYGDKVALMSEGEKAMSYESQIQKAADGQYEWTDRSGNYYKAASLEEMKEQQEMIRSGYRALQGQETDIMKTSDGRYSWTDRDGNVHLADSYAAMSTIRDSVQKSYSQGMGPNSNLRNYNMAQDMVNRYVTNDGRIVSGQTKIDSNGKEVLNVASGLAAASVIGNLSSREAMAGNAGSNAISNIKAATILSHDYSTASALMNSSVEGGINDSQVIGATYQKLFGDNVTENGVDNIVPGLSEAMAGNTEYGAVSDVQMNNGEITGTYTHDGISEDFSIRNEESYNSLSPEEQSNYHAFEGADGTYYADSNEVILNNIGDDGKVSENVVSDTPSGIGQGGSEHISGSTINESVSNSSVSNNTEIRSESHSSSSKSESYVNSELEKGSVGHNYHDINNVQNNTTRKHNDFYTSGKESQLGGIPGGKEHRRSSRRKNK